MKRQREEDRRRGGCAQEAGPFSQPAIVQSPKPPWAAVPRHGFYPSIDAGLSCDARLPSPPIRTAQLYLLKSGARFAVSQRRKRPPAKGSWTCRRHLRTHPHPHNPARSRLSSSFFVTFALLFHSFIHSFLSFIPLPLPSSLYTTFTS